MRTSRGAAAGLRLPAILAEVADADPGLAATSTLTTTTKYMHLAKGHEEQAIRLLDHRGDTASEPLRGGGDVEGKNPRPEPGVRWSGKGI